MQNIVHRSIFLSQVEIFISFCYNYENIKITYFYGLTIRLDNIA